ncbi:MAG: NUDIX hydrolase [Thermoguttaceae bacterium]
MDTIFTSKIFKVVKRFVTGRTGSKLERHVVVHPGAIAIVPILDDGSILLERQFRVAVGANLIEIPAGTLEPDEPPATTARRELREETGYTATELELLTTFYPSPGILQETMHLFLATGLIAGPTDLEDGEEIEVFQVPLAEAVDMVFQGQIRDAKTIVGILWYAAIVGAKTTKTSKPA